MQMLVKADQAELASALSLLAEVERDRDGWKSECDMYARAWQRELKGLIPKTHLIDSLVLTTRGLLASERSLRLELKELKASLRALAGEEDTSA